MKPLEEMTDQELSAEYFAYGNRNRGDVGKDIFGVGLSEIVNEMVKRLSTHPAQRIADLSGCVVTKDINGMWKQWIMWTTGNTPNKSDDGFWCSNVADSIVIKLPDDNRPWQESIYKPQVNVRNGGRNDG